jgi:hypothetical protein
MLLGDVERLRDRLAGYVLGGHDPMIGLTEVLEELCRIVETHRPISCDEERDEAVELARRINQEGFEREVELTAANRRLRDALEQIRDGYDGIEFVDVADVYESHIDIARAALCEEAGA